MGYTIALCLGCIMSVVAAIHFFWTMGGKWGLDGALPELEEGSKKFEVGPVMCLAAAIVFSSIAFFYFQMANQFLPSIISDSSNPLLFSYGSIGLGAIFLIRAIGEFKYVGFFKSVRNTKFGRLDSKYFSPLCLLLGLGSLALYFLTH